MKFNYFVYLFIFITPFLMFSQTSPKKMSGEVFRAYSSNPSEDIRESTIEVNRSLYGLTFKDPEINDKYKKAVEQFFKESFRGYDKLGKYVLKIERKQNYIWIEGRKTAKLDDEN